MKTILFIKSIVLVILVTASIAALTHRQESTALIHALLQGLDPLEAAALYVLLCIVAALVMFPVSMLMIFSGAYFGLWVGFGLNLLGFISGAVAAFLTARHLARDQITRMLPPKALSILDNVGASGWKTVAVTRIVTIIPGVLVNYVLGLSPLPLRTFIWASLLFTIPNDFILTYAGVAGEAFVNGGDLGKLLTAITLLGVGMIAAWLLRKRLLKP